MKFSGSQIQSLEKALLAAFPAPADLRRMVSYQLDENLDAIAGGNNQTDLLFNLFKWAEAQGRLDDLINGAVAANPGNPKLQAWMASHAGDQAGPENTGGNNITVGDISGVNGVAIGTGAQVTVNQNYYDSQADRRS